MRRKERTCPELVQCGHRQVGGVGWRGGSWSDEPVHQPFGESASLGGASCLERRVGAIPSVHEVLNGLSVRWVRACHIT